MWLITPDAVRAFGLPPRDTVQQAAAAMQAAMTGPPDPHAPAALGGMLLDQIATAIEGKRLVIVADAPLQGQVPFAALMVPSPSAEQGQPLVQFHEYRDRTIGRRACVDPLGHRQPSAPRGRDCRVR